MSTAFVVVLLFLSLPFMACFVAGMVWRDQARRFLRATKPRKHREP